MQFPAGQKVEIICKVKAGQGKQHGAKEVKPPRAVQADFIAAFRAIQCGHLLYAGAAGRAAFVLPRGGGVGTENRPAAYLFEPSRYQHSI